MDIQSIRDNHALIYSGATVIGGSILGAAIAPASAWWLLAEGAGVIGGGFVTIVGVGASIMSFGGFGPADEKQAARAFYAGATITTISIAAFAATLTGSSIVGALAPAALGAGYGVVKFMRRCYERRQQG